MAGLSREVLKWLQGLGLSMQVRNPKWDFTNGYLIAEIMSFYYPDDVLLHTFSNGLSLDNKWKNWALLKTVFRQYRMRVPEDLIDGTIHCRNDAAVLLVEYIFQKLTHREVKKKLPYSEPVDFTDENYQLSLAYHARPTATKSVKNNIKNTELITDQNTLLAQHKAQVILDKHLNLRDQQRKEKPNYYEVRPTLAERCPRKLPDDKQLLLLNGQATSSRATTLTAFTAPEHSGQRASSVQFKEVSVKQHLPLGKVFNEDTDEAARTYDIANYETPLPDVADQQSRKPSAVNFGLPLEP